MGYFKYFFLFGSILFSSYTSIGYAQSNVKISRDIGIRNEFSYEILPNFFGKNLLFRDRGREFFIDIFDNEMEFIRTDELTFDVRRCKVNKVLVKDSLLYLFHTFNKKDTTVLAVRYYGEGLNLLKSDTLLKYKSEEFDIDFKEITSFDESKLLLFQLVKSTFLSIVVNVNGYESNIYSSIKSNFMDKGDRESFRGVRVTNQGSYFVVFEEGNSWDRPKDHAFSLFYNAGSAEFIGSKITLPKVLSSGVRINYDEQNKRIALAGLYSTKSTDEIEGIYLFNKPISQITPYEEVELLPLDSKLVQELYGKKKVKKPIIRDHVIKLLKHRSDGGVVIVTEMEKEFSRRGGAGISPFAPTNNFNNNGPLSVRNLVDFYNEDMLVFSINKDATTDWRKVFFKKQFSQDDNGIFSSFFYFATDNRMRLIFNDEIKSSNTVSEYVLDPLGRFERNALLNTDYKDLKLRFRDAVQISANEFIVPSERNYKLALVKLKI